MKRLSFLFSVALLLLLSSCSKEQGKNLIPEDAIFVMRIDLTQALEKTGIQGDDDSSIKDWLAEQIKMTVSDEDVREKMLDIIEDPTRIGIDFTEPLYVYGSAAEYGDFEGGLVGTVASKGDLNDFFEIVSKSSRGVEINEGDGADYIMLDRKTAFIYNGDWFYLGVVLAGDRNKPDIDATIAALVERASGNGVMDNKAFDLMCEKKGVMQMGYFGAGFEALGVTDQMAKQLPDGLEIKDIAGVLDFVINDGEFVMTGEPVALSDDWQNYLEESMKNVKAIDTSLTKYASAKGLTAFLSLDIKSLKKKIIESLKMTPMFRMNSEQEAALKEVLDVLTGTAVLSISGVDSENGPVLKAYIGTKSNMLVNKITDGKLDDEGVITEGANQFKIPISYDYDIDQNTGEYIMTPTNYMAIGFKNDMTYCLMNTDEKPFEVSGATFKKDDLQGVGIYFRLTSDLVKDAIMKGNDRNQEIAKAVGDLFDYAELYMEDGAKAVARIAMKDKDQSPIVSIIQYFKKFLR